MTEWRTIPSCPNYQASDEGDIRRGHDRWSPEKPGVCLVKFVNGFGRARVGIGNGGNSGRKYLVSRLVCEAFQGPAPSEKHQAAHNDGNKKNDIASNLRWATRQENYQDQIKHGTSKRGEGHHNAKLTEVAVREIRDLAKTTKQRVLAKQFGVSDAAISTVVTRTNWPHVK